MNTFTDTPCDLLPEEEQELNSSKALNERQEQFCHEYMVDFNAGLAAMRCGYKPYGAPHTAYRLLRTVAVKKRLRELKQEQREQSHISFGFIIEKFLRIADDAMEGDPVLVYDQSAKTWKDTGRKKPDRPTALKALALLGKHIGMFDKEYAQTIQREEEGEQTAQEKQGQLLDSFMDAALNLQDCQKENQRLKAALAEAGIEIPAPVTKEGSDSTRSSMVNGSMRALNPSEYDDKPHYEYKHILPHKNHPEHQLVTPEKMEEAIRKKVSQLPFTIPRASGETPPKAQ